MLVDQCPLAMVVKQNCALLAPKSIMLLAEIFGNNSEDGLSLLVFKQGGHGNRVSSHWKKLISRANLYPSLSRWPDAVSSYAQFLDHLIVQVQFNMLPWECKPKQKLFVLSLQLVHFSFEHFVLLLHLQQSLGEQGKIGTEHYLQEYEQYLLMNQQLNATCSLLLKKAVTLYLSHAS